MLHTNNIRVIKIKDFYKKVQKCIAISIALFAILGCIYFIYWAIAMTDETLVDYTSKYFNPLASLLFPYDNSISVYRSTSYVLFSLIIPTIILFNISDKICGHLIDLEFQKEEKNRLEKIKQKRIKDLMQYEEIRCYSICLMIDYEKDKKIKAKNIQTLNNVAFSKITSEILKKYSDLKISANEFLIVKSNNFEEYDGVYNIILKTLSKIKCIYEEKYDFKVIPNIISDAYLNDESMQKITKYNQDIKKLNFKNRALSTAQFSKKYKYLKHNKYAGIPIGEYALFKGNHMGTFELNMVYKNLAKTLTEIKQ